MNFTSIKTQDATVPEIVQILSAGCLGASDFMSELNGGSTNTNN